MTARSLLLLVAIVFLSAGCASKRKAPYRPQKRTRDYYSANKASLSFLFDTFRRDSEMRGDRRNRLWEPGERRHANATVQKESIAFLWDALKAGEVDSWKRAWTEQFPEMLKGPKDFGASVRMGFLDHGE